MTAGFRVVTRGVIGDELVANEYLRLWEDEPWGTLVRSTDPVVVETVRTQYPELVPYLAPVATPTVAETRYLRARYGASLPVVYAGHVAPPSCPEVDAAVTFSDLEQLLRMRSVSALTQPTFFQRIPEERRRHLSAAGGMPLAMLEESRQAAAGSRSCVGSMRCRRSPARSRRTGSSWGSWTSSRTRVRSTTRSRGRRKSSTGGARSWRVPSRRGAGVRWWTGRSRAASAPRSRSSRARPRPMRQRWRRCSRSIGTAPNGKPWNCGACGYGTCLQFARSAVAGRASLKQCPPHEERRANEAVRAAAVDVLTGLATYRVLQERLQYEVERSKRSDEAFAVLFIDLDSFKLVNDRYGHEAGNDILRAVAAEIRAAVRASDVAARYGGDEFVVILTRTDLAGATRVAEALRAGIEGVGRRLGYRQEWSP